jgi:hypothetical protein
VDTKRSIPSHSAHALRSVFKEGKAFDVKRKI